MSPDEFRAWIIGIIVMLVLYFMIHGWPWEKD